VQSFPWKKSAKNCINHKSPANHFHELKLWHIRWCSPWRKTLGPESRREGKSQTRGEKKSFPSLHNSPAIRGAEEAFEVKETLISEAKLRNEKLLRYENFSRHFRRRSGELIEIPPSLCSSHYMERFLMKTKRRDYVLCRFSSRASLCTAGCKQKRKKHHTEATGAAMRRIN
jgi:hypothetical protein